MIGKYVEQVDGDHYAKQGAPGRQHWDIVDAYDLGYLEGNATKYIVRYNLKGQPVVDLQKALSYLRKMQATGRGTRRMIPGMVLLDWFKEVGIDDAWKRQVLILVMGTRKPDFIEEAAQLIQQKLNDLQGVK
jgi:hypothetical protein